MNINNKEQFNELKLQVFNDFNSQYNFANAALVPENLV